MRLDVERLKLAPGREISIPSLPGRAGRRLPVWRRLLLRIAIAGPSRRD